MKKYTIPAVVVLVLLLIPVGIWAVRKQASNNQQPQQQEQKKKVSKPVNTIPTDERPYVVLTPTLNREIDVTVKRVVKEADGVEFLAEYQYGTSLGGNENFISLSSLPATKQFALYSRSAGGKTSYEEDVKGGSLTLKFQGTEEYWLKQEWNYYDRINPKSSTKESVLTSRDAKFSISGDSLKPVKYIIIYHTPGYPEKLSGTALSEMYVVQFAGTPAGKTADVRIRMNEEAKGAIFGWDGKEWKEFETTINGKEATATVELMESYIVIAK